jgi:hypothetical protein
MFKTRHSNAKQSISASAPSHLLRYSSLSELSESKRGLTIRLIYMGSGRYTVWLRVEILSITEATHDLRRIENCSTKKSRLCWFCMKASKAP